MKGAAALDTWWCYLRKEEGLPGDSKKGVCYIFSEEAEQNFAEEGVSMRSEWRERFRSPFYSVDVSLCATEGFKDNRGGTPQISVEWIDASEGICMRAGEKVTPKDQGWKFRPRWQQFKLAGETSGKDTVKGALQDLTAQCRWQRGLVRDEADIQVRWQENRVAGDRIKDVREAASWRKQKWHLEADIQGSASEKWWLSRMGEVLIPDQVWRSK